MLARYDGSNDILVLTDGSKGGIILDPAQPVRYTGGVHKLSPYGPGSGRWQSRRGHLYLTNVLSHFTLDLSSISRYYSGEIWELTREKNVSFGKIKRASTAARVDANRVSEDQ
jgi:hypothetical protein